MSDNNNKKVKTSYSEKIGIEDVPMTVAQLVAQLCWQDGHVPLFVSESGIGKTAVMKTLSKAVDARFILYNLAHCEPPDISGPQFPSGDDTYVNLRDGRIPFEGYDNSEERAILAFDEVNRADMSVLNAVFPAWSEHRLGVHTIGPEVRLAAMMNPPGDAYAVTSQFSSDPAMRRRVCTIGVSHSPEETLSYARDPKGAAPKALPWRSAKEIEEARAGRPWHAAVVQYLSGNPEFVLDEKLRDAGRVYGCPATWEQVSDTLYTIERLVDSKAVSMSDPTLRRAIQCKIGGHVGAPHVRPLLAIFTESMEVIPPKDIIVGYRKNKALRERIQRLVSSGSTGQLITLNNQVVAQMHATMDTLDMEKVADSLSAYLNDIPLQAGQALVQTINTGSHGEAGTRLSIALSKVEDFRNYRRRLVDASQEAMEALKKQRENDDM